MNCTADIGHRCDANNGEPCDGCVRSEADDMAAARRDWNRASPQERNPQQYERDMREAGRGHLLGDR